MDVSSLKLTVLLTQSPLLHWDPIDSYKMLAEISE